jgi:predicted helicase
VIVGNPPYSVGQDSANDDNANEKYPTLDGEIERTYVARSTATSKRTLYDSYIRAIKWATLRLGDRGVVAFVTNGGFLESNAADGMRQTLAEEFSTIHVFNLRGNRRQGGAEGRPIWEAFAKGTGGSIATIAIVVLVKRPENSEPATVFYSQVGDFTTATEKVAEVVAAGSISGLSTTAIMPNEHGDWISQRRDDFEAFLPLTTKGGTVAVRIVVAGARHRA